MKHLDTNRYCWVVFIQLKIACLDFIMSRVKKKRRVMPAIWSSLDALDVSTCPQESIGRF